MTNAKRTTKPLTDEQESEIQRQIAEDPDDADATTEELAMAKPFEQAFPQLADSIRRTRGRPKLDAPKTSISLRLSPDVIAKFKATGPGWQRRINDVLAKAKL